MNDRATTNVTADRITAAIRLAIDGADPTTRAEFAADIGRLLDRITTGGDSLPVLAQLRHSVAWAARFRLDVETGDLDRWLALLALLDEAVTHSARLT